jgi:SpoIID/LytB domain protein
MSIPHPDPQHPANGRRRRFSKVAGVVALVTLVASLVVVPVAGPAAAEDHADPPAVPEESTAESAAAGDPVGAQQVAPDLIEVQGRGWGHGRGLSQWGSLGYAVDHGWTSAQILDHYYGGTVAGTLPEREVSIHLTKNDGRDLLVTSSSAFTVLGVGFTANQVARLQVTGTTDSTRFAVRLSTGCGDTGTAVAAGAPGTVGQNGYYSALATPSSADPTVDDIGQTLVMIRCGSDNPGVEVERRAYRGSLGLVEQGGTAYSFNRLPLEQYLRGVVPRESPSWWGGEGGGKGVAALEAQAVAARSYALALAAARLASGKFTDACDTTACQVYGGAWLWQPSAGLWLPLDNGATYAHSNAAIGNTVGVVRTHPSTGNVVLTEFASSTGGWTAPLSENSGFPAVEDLGDSYFRNPRHTWTLQIKRTDVEAMFPSIGQLTSIQVTRRNGLGPWGGRTRQIVVQGTAGSQSLDIANWGSDSFRKRFGLYSDWYEFPQFPDHGFWVAKSDGAVLGFGAAAHHGDADEMAPGSPVVDMATTSSGNGYWLTTSAGDIYAFGDATHQGSMSGVALNAPVVGIAAHPDGDGYWLVASDGGIFAFGSAQFHGSMGGTRLNQPMVGIEATASGRGYWTVASDGGVFAFGDAQFHGSTGDIRLNKPITSMTAAPDGSGYWFVATDGGVFAFGSVGFYGSRGGNPYRRPITGMAVTRSGNGYWLVADNGASFPYGDAPDFVSSVAGLTVTAVEVSP